MPPPGTSGLSTFVQTPVLESRPLASPPNHPSVIALSSSVRSPADHPGGAFALAPRLPLSSVVIQHGAKTGAPRIEVILPSSPPPLGPAWRCRSPPPASLGAIEQLSTSLDIVEHDLDEIGRLNPRSRSRSASRATAAATAGSSRTPRATFGATEELSTMTVAGEALPSERAPEQIAMRAPLIRSSPASFATTCPLAGPGHSHSDSFREAALAHMQRIESDLCKLRQSFGLPTGQPTGLLAEPQPRPMPPATPQQLHRPPVLERPPWPPLAPRSGGPQPAMHQQDLSPGFSTISSVWHDQERSELTGNGDHQAFRCAVQPQGALSGSDTPAPAGNAAWPATAGTQGEAPPYAEAESKDRVLHRVFGSPLACADITRQVTALSSSIAALRRDSQEKEMRWAKEREELSRKLAEVQQQAAVVSQPPPQQPGKQDLPQRQAHKLPPRWDWNLPAELASARQPASLAGVRLAT